MFSLHEVRNITFSVDSSHQEPLSSSSAVLLRDKGKVEFVIVLLESLYVQESKDARDFEWSILRSFKIFEKVRVEGKLRYVVYSVGISLM